MTAHTALWHAYHALRRRTRRQIRDDNRRRARQLNRSLGIEIAVLRIGAGISTHKAAMLAGIPFRRLLWIEEGQCAAGVAEIETIAVLFGTTMPQLYQAAAARIADGRLPSWTSEDTWMASLGIVHSDDYFVRFIDDHPHAVGSQG